jgi:hypothetical protein
VDHDQAATRNSGQDFIGSRFDPGLADALTRNEGWIRLQLLGGRHRDVAGDVRGLLTERVDARRLGLD